MAKKKTYLHLTLACLSPTPDTTLLAQWGKFLKDNILDAGEKVGKPDRVCVWFDGVGLGFAGWAGARWHDLDDYRDVIDNWVAEAIEHCPEARFAIGAHYDDPGAEDLAGAGWIRWPDAMQDDQGFSFTSQSIDALRAQAQDDGWVLRSEEAALSLAIAQCPAASAALAAPARARKLDGQLPRQATARLAARM